MHNLCQKWTFLLDFFQDLFNFSWIWLQIIAFMFHLQYFHSIFSSVGWQKNMQGLAIPYPTFRHGQKGNKVNCYRLSNSNKDIQVHSCFLQFCSWSESVCLMVFAKPQLKGNKNCVFSRRTFNFHPLHGHLQPIWPTWHWQGCYFNISVCTGRVVTSISQSALAGLLLQYLSLTLTNAAAWHRDRVHFQSYFEMFLIVHQWVQSSK